MLKAANSFKTLCAQRTCMDPDTSLSQGVDLIVKTTHCRTHSLWEGLCSEPVHNICTCRTAHFHYYPLQVLFIRFLNCIRQYTLTNKCLQYRRRTWMYLWDGRLEIKLSYAWSETKIIHVQNTYEYRSNNDNARTSYTWCGRQHEKKRINSLNPVIWRRRYKVKDLID